ncbi:hypothetical protein CHGG_02412 [Chaetomium globosum CBS 148.51]|uniref:Nucleoside phosphorylase domain-containing protein n=1 Tax=Chaetomium globosum (strain ATCC 6205 / CBS 148.51 / DSM 1962 / NBRC 6347 / NRRL 1970) TaxID=306901 RepID=Q2HBJ2_CHAGB|nr:uncharacterized protein CHGG_02412 [Chaetomium globosum CBS 148.51]EAQ90477.1 hypothetical protein CHGG_02412 [Chaetomium globosum CBS 148.51]
MPSGGLEGAVCKRPQHQGPQRGCQPYNPNILLVNLTVSSAFIRTMTSHNALDSPDYYGVAWIAALPIERAAAKAMLDEEHAPPTGFVRHQTDANVYTWGSGGGIARPDEDYDIRLGDVVVSRPDGTTGGVCQYDLIKAKSGDRRERKGFLRPPPTVLLNALVSIQADHESTYSKVPNFLQQMLKKNPKMNRRSKQNPGYIHQGTDNDRLFQPSCHHVPGPDCRSCNTAGEVKRDARDTTDPEIHYGTIASGNSLVKDAATRDRIVADVGVDCICFEMEAAGLMNHFPCLVIRGICDYADSHKNDRWQRYASATAAAYTKELLANSIVCSRPQLQRNWPLIPSRPTFVPRRSSAGFDPLIRLQTPTTRGSSAMRGQVRGSWKVRSSKSGTRGCVDIYGCMGSRDVERRFSVRLCWIISQRETTVVSSASSLTLATRQSRPWMPCCGHLLSNSTDAGLVLQVFLTPHSKHTRMAATNLQRRRSQMFYSRCSQSRRKVSIVLDALDESRTRADLLLWIKDVVSRPELGHVQLICTGRPEAEFLRDIPPVDRRGKQLRTQQAGCQRRHPIIRRSTAFATTRISGQALVAGSPRADPDLVTVVHAAGKELHLAHFSVKEYLLRDERFNITIASIPIARTCLTYLTDINGNHEEIKRDFPMARFAAEVWTYYATFAQASENMVQTTVRFLEEEVTFQRWARLYQSDRAWDDDPGPPLGSRLYYACFAGLVTPAQILISKGADVNGQGGFYGNALQAASLKGHQEIVKLLLDKGADVNAQGGGYGNALRAASLEGHQEIVKLLLDKGADVNGQGGGYGNALRAASLEGHQEIVKLLLDKGADVNAQGGFYGNALQAASLRGHQEVVKPLLDKGADVNAQGGRYGNALQAASLEGHQEIVKLLLDKGADVNAQGGGYGNALQAASSKGYQEIVKLFEKRGGMTSSLKRSSSRIPGNPKKKLRPMVPEPVDQMANRE